MIEYTFVKHIGRVWITKPDKNMNKGMWNMLTKAKLISCTAISQVSYIVKHTICPNTTHSIAKPFNRSIYSKCNVILQLYESKRKIMCLSMFCIRNSFPVTIHGFQIFIYIIRCWKKFSLELYLWQWKYNSPLPFPIV